MARRDPVAAGLLGLGCALIIGAPVVAVATSCAASSHRGAQAPSSTAPTPAPAARPAAPHADAQSPAPEVAPPAPA